MDRKGKFTMKISSLKCFWTWPFGHIWGDNLCTGSSFDRQCVICYKESSKGSYTRCWHYDISSHAKYISPLSLAKDRDRNIKNIQKSKLALKRKQSKLMVQ